MNTGEQRELRQWADQLCEVDDPERRAMGRAIAMLLDRIEELEKELSAAAQAALNGDPEPNGEPSWHAAGGRGRAAAGAWPSRSASARTPSS